MRIHLISPTHYLRDGSILKTTRYWTSAITCFYLKALTPSPYQVDFTDELMHHLVAWLSPLTEASTTRSGRQAE